MKNQTYQEKLKDPRWQRARLEKMDEAGWQCQICQDKKTELHVHHIRYDRAEDSMDGDKWIRDPWDYALGELLCLCSDCHLLVHIPNWKIEAFAKAYELKYAWKVAEAGVQPLLP